MNRNNLINVNNNINSNLEELRPMIPSTSSNVNNNNVSTNDLEFARSIMQEYLTDHNLTLDEFKAQALNSHVSVEDDLLPENIVIAPDPIDDVNNNNNIDPQRVNRVALIMRNSIAIGQRLAQAASLSEVDNVSHDVHQAVERAVQSSAQFVVTNTRSSFPVGAIVAAGSVVAGGVMLFTFGRLPFRLLPDLSTVAAIITPSSAPSTSVLNSLNESETGRLLKSPEKVILGILSFFLN